MGFDAVRGPNTYGSGCMPGCKRQFDWWMQTYDAGTLGCYNPASMGGRSLHAEGRAMDIALNANDPAQRARGDAIFERVMRFPEQFGAQEMLWRGYIWSWQRRSEGKRGPGIQQADHMNHVHLGIDVNAAKNWQPSWVGEEPKPKPEPPKPSRGDDMVTVYTIRNAKDIHPLWLVDGVKCIAINQSTYDELAQQPLNFVHTNVSKEQMEEIQAQCAEARSA